MPTGDAFIESYFDQALVSSETRGRGVPTATTATNPPKNERQ
jgi:hypothetical protein